ncbi:hypothetical protein Taro_043561, partial [Colocasia esculenta]|nr:hypothetical protein [Colocasia esculenta]
PTTRALQTTQRRCPNHRFPLSSRVRLLGCQLENARSPEYSLNRLPRTGVPGNGNNLSHGTSPQVSSTGRTTSSRRIGPSRPCRDTPKSVAIMLRPARLSRQDRDLYSGRVFSRGGFRSSPSGNHPKNTK